MKTTKWTPDRIRTMRKRYGLSQSGLVERLPITIYTLQFWEQGRDVVSEAGEWMLDRVEKELAEEAKAATSSNGKHRAAVAAV